MAYPDDLPTLTDASLGRPKTSGVPLVDINTQVRAVELEVIKETLVAVTTVAGTADGTTVGSLIARANAMDSLGATFLTRGDFTFDSGLTADVYDVPAGGRSYVIDFSGWDPGDVYAVLLRLPPGTPGAVVSVQSGEAGTTAGVPLIFFPNGSETIDGSPYTEVPSARFQTDRVRCVIAWIGGMWRTVLASSVVAAREAGRLGGAEVPPDQTLGDGMVAQLDAGGIMRWRSLSYVGDFAVTQRLEALRTFPSHGNARKLVWREDFFSSSGLAGGLTVGGSGGTSSVVAPSVATRTGVLRLNRGTTPTNNIGVFIANSQVIRFGGGRWRFRSDIRIPVLSNGTDRFPTYAGFNDSPLGDGQDGAYFRVVDNVNAGRWQFVTRSNSIETVLDTGVTPVAGAWTSLEIEVDAAGTLASPTINGLALPAISSNIPTGAGRETGLIAANLVGLLGTTSVALEIDVVEWSFEPTGGL